MHSISVFIEQILIALTLFLLVNILRVLGVGELLWPPDTSEGVYLIQFIFGALIAASYFHLSAITQGASLVFGGLIRVIGSIIASLIVFALVMYLIGVVNSLVYGKGGGVQGGDHVFFTIMALVWVGLAVVLFITQENRRVILSSASILELVICFFIGALLIISFTRYEGVVPLILISFAFGIIAYLSFRGFAGHIELSFRGERD